MLAAAIAKPTSWWEQFGFNWFDVALVLLLAFGFWRGRKRGMTKELLPTLQWLCVLFAAGLGHIFVADWLQQGGYIKQVFGDHFNERTAALMTGYLVISLVLIFVFTGLKRKYNPKLEGSSVFGGNEYYLGVIAGLIRYLCLVLVALALLNAPVYTQAYIEAAKAYNNRWFGGGLKEFSGDFIPSVYEMQDTVFKKSFIGPLIKQNLSILLINSEASSKPNHF
jgi:uncharacterized membrane protein required for colicin V production